MIDSGVGISEKTFTEIAAREAISMAMDRTNISKADLAFVFATANHAESFPELLEMVRERTQCQRLIGCSGMGVLSTDLEIEHRSGLVVLVVSAPELNTAAFVVPLEDNAVAIAEKICDRIEDEIVGNSVLILLSDVFAGDPGEVIQGIQDRFTSLPIVGGAASGSPYEKQTYQFCNGQVATDSITGMLLSGPMMATIGIAQGCQPIGEPYVITKAESNVIFEIAGQSPTMVLQNAINALPKEDVQRARGAVFAGIAVNPAKHPLTRGDFIIRNIISIDPDSGAIAVADEVDVGQTFQFNLRDVKAAITDIDETLKGLAKTTARLDRKFGLYFNCLGRGYGLYGRSSYDIKSIREYLGEFPIAGFFGNGEFAPIAGKNLVHNYTGALVVISEPA